MTSHDGDVVEALSIGQIGSSGRCKRVVVYDPEHSVEAQLELDRLWFEELGFGVGHFLHAMGPAGYITDPTALAPYLHPEFDYVDRRTESSLHSTNTVRPTC